MNMKRAMTITPPTILHTTMMIVESLIEQSSVSSSSGRGIATLMSEDDAGGRGRDVQREDSVERERGRKR